MDSFSDFANKINKLTQEIEDIIIDEMDEKSTMCVTTMQVRTPVKTGNLRQSEGKEDLKIEDKTYSIKLGADLDRAPYALLIEYGGMGGNGGFYVGRHMINDSITIYQKELENSIQSKIEDKVFSRL